MNKAVGALFFLLLTQAAHGQAPGDAAIRSILRDRIDVQKQGVGIVAGVIDSSGKRIVPYGSMLAGEKRPVDGDTVFEIGSVTKVFTALLLADMVARGEVELTDPVSKYLPSSVKVPQRGGKSITLEHLATHTSGLPRLPSNLMPADPSNPYADYSADRLYEFLSGYELTRDIGAKYEYSNLGAGLLGHALALRAKSDYGTLVRTRILEPLGMKSTSIALSDEMKSRLATGHDANLKRAANWDLTTLAGAGALRSTVNDMLIFVGAAAGLGESPLAAAMKSMLAARRATDSPGLDIALGWHILKANGRESVWHNGGTGGYRSFVGFDPELRTGVVVLSNTSTAAGVDDIGRHLLDPRAPLIKPQQQRVEVKVDPTKLEQFVGRYELAPNFILAITLGEEGLSIQPTNQPKSRIFAESETKFFSKVVDAQITFDVGAEGPATGLTLHQNGANVPGKRIEGAEPEEAAQPEGIEVDPKILERYKGDYELAPNFILSITHDGKQLAVQATGQPKFAGVAVTESEFNFPEVGARITFVTGDDGRVTSLTLHQNGRDMPAKRIAR